MQGPSMPLRTFFCPHCGDLLEKDERDWAYGQLDGFVLFGGNTTETCPTCHRPIDRLLIIQGKYDQPGVPGRWEERSGCPQCGSDQFKRFRLQGKDVHKCTSCGYKDY